MNHRYFSANFKSLWRLYYKVTKPNWNGLKEFLLYFYLNTTNLRKSECNVKCGRKIIV